MSRRRRGIALVAALMLMTLIAVLVVGGVASSAMASRTSRLGQTDALLTAASDFAITSILADSAVTVLAQLPFGQRRTFDLAIDVTHGINTEVAAIRLKAGIVWLVAESTQGGMDDARRRVNVIARFPSVGAVPQAGIVARGAVALGSHVLLSRDSTADPSCVPNPGPDVVVASGSSVTGLDSTRVAHHASASDSAMYLLSSRQQSALHAGHGVVVTSGDTTIAGGMFDGILIVNGNLTIGGPLTLVGLAVARGRIMATAGGLSVTGALMAYAPVMSSTFAIQVDGATIRYSPCAVERVMRVALAPRAVPQRSWAELF